MDKEKEIVNLMALARVSNYGLTDASELYRRAGSATAVADNCRDIRAVLPTASDRLVRAVASMDTARAAAEADYAHAVAHNIRPVAISDSRYPSRLRECDGAPLLLYTCGTADLNARRVVSVVGTRHATAYGHDLTRRLVSDLARLCPGTLVVSGLAYGIDICAHTAALDAALPTLAVLAHGLDTIYPSRHTDTARRMARQGGLLTEYPRGTRPERLNFLRRNRIVAGMADAVVLVESAAHGGGLVTTRIAGECGRPVFAFPGAVGAAYSEGCNALIRSGGARLITSAADMVEALGWQTDRQLSLARQQGIERTLFPDLSPDEQRVADALSAHGDLQADALSLLLSLPIARLTPLLFALEMKGVVRLYAGGVYHLVK